MSTLTASASESTAPPMGFLQRVIGVFTSPRRVFESLRDHPVWVDVTILYLVVGILTYIPMQPIIREQSIDQAAERLEQRELTEEQRAEAMEQQRAMMDKMLSLPVGIGMALVFTPIVFLFWALVIWFAYSFLAGGRLTFRHAFAATVHLSLIMLLAGVVKLPLILAKKSMYVATSLALVLPETEPGSLPYAVLNTFDVFVIWTLIVMAIGMAVLARVSPGKSRGVAIGIFILLLIISAVGGMVSGMGGA